MAVEPVTGDVVYLPRHLFERLFDDFEGGVLGVMLRANEETMYATAAPSAERGEDIYIPLWMATVFEQRTLRDLEVLDFTVERAEPVTRASLIVVRQCVEMEIDVRSELESFFYDCRYVHANMVVHIAGYDRTLEGSAQRRGLLGCDLWIERIVDMEGFEVAVAELGHEVSVDIQDALDDGGRAEAAKAEEIRVAEAARAEEIRVAEAARAEEIRVAEAARVVIPDAATIREQRLRFFDRNN